MTNNISVCLFDDHTQLRDSISYLLEEAEGFACAGAFKDCSNILRDITKCNPDVVLMDIDMPGINGIEAVQMIKEKFPELKILMLTVFEDDDKIFNSLCAGASGYILKSASPLRILDAIKEIHDGGVPMTPTVAVRVLRMFRTQSEETQPESFLLSDREKEILGLLVKGMSYKMIASQCFISVETVNNHLRNIYRKMNVHSKGEAITKAIRGKIV